MMSIFKRIFDIQFFLYNVLVPLIALAVYCGSFEYFSSRFMLEGVNYFFVSKLLKYLLFVIAAATLAFLVILNSQSGRKPLFRFSTDKFYPGDLLLLLLPLTPIVQYILNNQEILSMADSLYVFVICTLLFSLYVIVIPALVGLIIPARTLMILGVAFVFTIASMASISDYFAWFEVGALRKQLMVLGGIFLVIWLLYNLNQRKVLYLFIVANLAVNSATQLLSQDASDPELASMEANELSTMVGERTPEMKPGIYLLIYDAYVPNETMLQYGIDNSAQESYLVDQGFKLYPHTYSVASSTLATMSRVLNAASDYYGDKRRGVSGNGITQDLLKGIGYETYGVFYSDYMFRGYGNYYDVSIPDTIAPPYIHLMKAILMGEFRFDIEKVGAGAQTHSQFSENKQDLWKTLPEGSVFVYMHTDRPAHSQNSGACMPNETDLFKKRLQEANSEMRKDVDLIIENDPGAILIIAGDHGPYLTKNCDWTSDVYDKSEISRLDVQDRYGTFLAIRWPTEEYKSYDNITVLQDIFPAIFAYIYEDPSILRSRIKPVIKPSDVISGVSVKDGILHGGIDDGEPLFLSDK